MQLMLAAVLIFGAAVSGCVCTCVSASAEFETACREQGGRVQRGASSAACVADGGVVATWVLEEEDGGS
jgi:hypothetical protein